MSFPDTPNAAIEQPLAQHQGSARRPTVVRLEPKNRINPAVPVCSTYPAAGRPWLESAASMKFRLDGASGEPK